MSFANPFLLLGLLGATVPIIIHLINRRRPRKQAFPAMELLQRSIQRVERRWRLRRWALLALRVLLLAALSLAAARPLIGDAPQRVLASGTGGPERLAVVVDASLSMRARYEGRSSFARALEAARRQIEGMGPEDQALIVFTGQPPIVPLARPTADRGRLFGILTEVRPSWRPAQLAEAVSTACNALGFPKDEEDAVKKRPATRVVVLTDVARHAFDGAATLDVPGTKVAARLEVIDVLADVESPRRNYGFAGIVVEAVPGEGLGTMEAQARVQSYDGAKDETRPRTLRWLEDEQELAAGTVEVAPSALTQKNLLFKFDEPGSKGTVLELEPDALSEDDRYFLKVEISKQVRLLVVDGAPSGVAKEDETFYLERALRAGAADQPPPTSVSADDLARTDLEQHDVVVLAGVSTLSRNEAERLVRFVEGGGGLWITVSDSIDVDAYNTGLGPILPRPLRGIKTLRRGTSIGLDKPDLDHPILEIFSGEALGGLISARNQAFMLLEPSKTPLTNILSFEGGAPALVLGQLKQGRVALLTTSIDRDLTDLPIRPAFVPLVRQTMLWLGDALFERETQRTLVGEPRDVVLPPGATRLSVIDPNGQVHGFTRVDLRGEQVRFPDTDIPGHYRVQAAFGGGLEAWPRADFAVNVDTVESDLRAFSAMEGRAILAGEASIAESGGGAAGGVVKPRRLSAEALSSVLLLIMGLAFLLESGLTAVRVGR